MRLRILLVALGLLTLNVANAADRMDPQDDRSYTVSPSLWGSVAAEPPAMRLLAGDDAPAFSYLGTDGAWHRFADLTMQKPTLLIFGARDADLVELEKTRGQFLDLGVQPVLVLDRRSGAAMKLAKRLGLSSPIVVDPQCAIADLYNSVDPLNHRHAPAFFVLDEKRTIRTIDHGPLPAPFQILRRAAQGLGRPLPESAWSGFEPRGLVLDRLR